VAVHDADVAVGEGREIELVTLARLLEVGQLDSVRAAEFAVLLRQIGPVSVVRAMAGVDGGDGAGRDAIAEMIYRGRRKVRLVEEL
jgi:predicted TIM-barrel enzyme